MSDVTWSMLDSNLIRVYFDSNAENVGRYSLTSVEHAYPYLSLLFGVKFKNDGILRSQNQEARTLVSRFNKITLILGDRLDGPGFANPITMNIEAQILHPHDSSFFQHELVHRLMYEHNNLYVGPLGRIWSLAMYPTWWIEGLAEYLTKSIGIYESNTILRQMALNSEWPTWERLHSLYNASGDENERGYVVSGEFLEWIHKNLNEKDLSVIHKTITRKTLIPPFFTATNNFLEDNLGLRGRKLYEKFKEEQTRFWSQKIPDFKGINELPSSKKILTRDYPCDVVVTKNNILISSLFSSKNVFQSSLISYDKKLAQVRRENIKAIGSSVFESFDNKIISTDRSTYNNDAISDDIVITTLSSNLNDDKLGNESLNVINSLTLNFSSEQNPYVINQIKKYSDTKFFIETSQRGENTVFIVDSQQKTMEKILHLPYPQFSKFIGVHEINGLACLSFILNEDRNSTSIKQICEDRTLSTEFEKDILYLKDGFLNQDGSYSVLAYWGDFLSLVEINKYETELIAYFPERVERLFPTKDKNIFLTWIYGDGEYTLTAVNRKELQKYFISWNNKFPASVKNRHTDYHRVISREPFEDVYQNQTKNILANAIAEPKFDISEYKINHLELIPKAPYQHKFIFAYPYGLPSILGGPSVNLIAFPLQDEMERYQFQINGGYNFYLKKFDGSITFKSNRIFDGFYLTLFSGPQFNGKYIAYEIDNNGILQAYERYNYLNNVGVSAEVNFGRFNPRMLWSVSSQFSKIEPYKNLDVPPSQIGAQSALLLGIKTHFSANLFTKGFYLSSFNKPNEEYGIWTIDGGIGAGKFNSLGEAKNSINEKIGVLNYYTLSANIGSRFTFFEHSISYNGYIAYTGGPHTFNLKQYYSPFQKYILGGSTSLNSVDYPIYTKSALYNILFDTTSYHQSLAWSIPLYKKFETLFLMSYVNNWRGLLEITNGGVAHGLNFNKANNISAINVGTSVDIDIKGFGIYPSIVYSHILNSKDFGIVFRVMFNTFL